MRLLSQREDNNCPPASVGQLFQLLQQDLDSIPTQTLVSLVQSVRQRCLEDRAATGVTDRPTMQRLFFFSFFYSSSFALFLLLLQEWCLFNRYFVTFNSMRIKLYE